MAVDMLEAIGFLTDFAFENFGGADFKGIGAYASDVDRVAKVAFRSSGKGYMVTLEEVDEKEDEEEEND